MKLSILDRVIIINSLLPASGTIETIKLIISIKNKIALSIEEIAKCKITNSASNMLKFEEITDELVTRDKDYEFTEKEVEFLKKVTANYSGNGWVTETSLFTVEYILNL